MCYPTIGVFTVVSKSEIKKATDQAKYLPEFRGSFKNRFFFLKSIKPHDLGSILRNSYFYSFTLEGL